MQQKSVAILANIKQKHRKKKKTKQEHKILHDSTLIE